MYRIFILSLLFSLFSCKNDPIITFYYTDGEIIKDTNQIRILKYQLDTLVTKENLQNDLVIKTTLHKKQNHIIHQELKKFYNHMNEEIKNDNPKCISEIDSLASSNNLLELYLIIINNHTGEIENYFSNNSYLEGIRSNRIRGRAIDLYGYQLCFQKGIHLTNTYNTFESNDILASENFTPTILESFYRMHSGISFNKPYRNYPKSDWISLNIKLGLRINLKNFHKGLHQKISIETSLYDLTKTLYTITKEAQTQPLHLIRLITDSKGKKLYKYKAQIEKVQLDPIIFSNMKVLINKFQTDSFGRLLYLRYGINEDGLAFFNRFSQNINWLIYSNQNYTIGILQRIHPIKKNYFVRTKRQWEYLTVLKHVLKGLKCNNASGKIRREVLFQEKENQMKAAALNL